MNLRSIAVGLICALASPAFGQVVVDGDWVALRDLAPVEGEAGDILITAAPPAGQTLALDPIFVTSVAKRAGVVVALPIGDPILVTRSALNAPIAPNAPVAPTPATIEHGGVAEFAPQPGWLLVAAHALKRGEVLQPSDLKWVSPEKARGSTRSPPRDLSAMVGMELKRALREDTPLQVTDVKAPDLIRKGDAVQLVYASRGLRLIASGTAQQNAARGEPVRILNQYSKRTIEAVAFAQGEARVTTR